MMNLFSLPSLLSTPSISNAFPLYVRDGEKSREYAKFVINADVANKIIDACRRGHAITLTGAVFTLQEIKSDPGKNIIVLQGSPEQVQEATPILLERIREFQDYEVAGNETMDVEKVN